MNSVINSLMFTVVCDSTAACSAGNPVEWNSVPLTQIGTINTRTTATQTFYIPSIISDSAREVLVYVHYEAGRNSQEISTNVKIFTESNSGQRFEKYIFFKTYPQEAYTATSENMWFPMMNRRVYAKLTSVLPSGVNAANVYVIGFR